MYNRAHFLLLFASLSLGIKCNLRATDKKSAEGSGSTQQEYLLPQKQITSHDTAIKTIHLFVALCDNQYQGIVKVPDRIGNGQDPNNNLYWGNKYGVKNFFAKSKEWIFVKSIKLDTLVLERVILKHAHTNYYLIADAYNGKYIKECTTNFLFGVSGLAKDTLKMAKGTIGIAGNATLLGYIGHNGLMEFGLDTKFNNKDNQKRSCIILACASKPYFSSFLEQANAYPLLWTTSLMCPEAYTIHDAISGFINNASEEQINRNAANAYAKYQKCSFEFASDLLVSGW